MEAKAYGFHPVAPRCVRATRWGRARVTQGDLVSSEREGMVEIVRHPQTKGRATGNANVGLKPPGGRGGYKRRAKFQPMRCQESERGIRTQERGVRAKGLGSLPCAAAPAGPKRPGGGGRPCALLRSGKRRNAASRYWRVGQFPMRKTQRQGRGDCGTAGPTSVEEKARKEESPLADRQGVQSEELERGLGEGEEEPRQCRHRRRDHRGVSRSVRSITWTSYTASSARGRIDPTP